MALGELREARRRPSENPGDVGKTLPLLAGTPLGEELDQGVGQIFRQAAPRDP